MGSPAATEPTKTKPETFRESRQREAFESIRRHLKNMLALRLGSSDPSTRKAAQQWQAIITGAEAK